MRGRILVNYQTYNQVIKMSCDKLEQRRLRNCRKIPDQSERCNNYRIHVLGCFPVYIHELRATVVVSSKVALEDFSLLPYFLTKQYKASRS